MTPDDPRHGSEAGHEQHLRDNEPSCDACTDADLKAARRRSKRRQMGHTYTRVIGTKLHTQLIEYRNQGARIDDISNWADISNSQVCRIINTGPTARVYTRTWLALANMKPTNLITEIGTQRRLQALARLGWSPAAIAQHAGLCADTIVHLREGHHHTNASSRAVIAEVYNELSMQLPVGETVADRRGIGKVRNTATRKGWLAPLCWDDIDHDPHPPRIAYKQPAPTLEYDHAVVERILTGDQLTPTVAERRAIVERLWTQGLGPVAIAKRCGLNKDNVEKDIERLGLKRGAA